MGKCVPGMPCYNEGLVVYTTWPAGCNTYTAYPFTTPISSEYLYYSGANLPYSGIQTEDTITVALQKIDVKLNPEEIFAAFIAAIDNNPTLKAEFCAKLTEC